MKLFACSYVFDHVEQIIFNEHANEIHYLTHSLPHAVIQAPLGQLFYK